MRLTGLVRISMLTVASVSLATVGISSAAFAAGDEPTDALKVVPGIEKAATTQTSTTVIGGGLGFQAATASGGTVQITRTPDNKPVSARAKGGQAVSKNTATKTDTIVQQLPAGAGRILEVMNSAAAPSTFDYSVKIPKGLETFEQPDGSILIGTSVTKGETTTMQVDGIIASPWAIDANGVQVPASYELQGEKLTMSVDESAVTAYPVVADPTFTKGGIQAVWTAGNAFYPTVYFNKARSEDIKTANEAACIPTVAIPGVGGIVSGICAASVVTLSLAFRYGYCVKATFQVAERRLQPGIYRGGFCS